MCWALIKPEIREQCEESGLVTVQIALADPMAIIGGRPPQATSQLGRLISNHYTREQLKAWVREKVAKQDRREKRFFILECLIVIFAFLAVAKHIADWVKPFDPF